MDSILFRLPNGSVWKNAKGVGNTSLVDCQTNWKIMVDLGFTLIELIVVIAILGILAAIAVPRLGGFTLSAKEAADKEAAAVLASSASMQAASTSVSADTTYTVAQLASAGLVQSGTAFTSTKYATASTAIEVVYTASTGVVSVYKSSTHDSANLVFQK